MSIEKEIVAIRRELDNLKQREIPTVGGGGGAIGGSGTTGRIAQFTAATMIGDSTLIKTGAGVLTLTAAGAYTLTSDTTGTAVVRATATALTAGRVPFVAGRSTLEDSSFFTYSPSELVITNPSFGTATVSMKFVSQTGNTRGRIIFIDAAGASHGEIGMYNRAAFEIKSGYGNPMVFYTYSAYPYTETERMRLVNTGNLLLGTSTDDGPRLNTVHTTTTANAILEVARFEAQVSTAATGASAGFGGAMTLYAESATNGNYRQQAQLASVWATATDATRKARSIWSVWDTAEREGIRIEASGSAPMLAFYGGSAVVRGAALTAQLTTLTHTAPGTPDYAIQDLVDSSVGACFGFATKNEGNTVLAVIANLQTRMAELEARLNAATGVNLFA